jgi:hypothetical protein
MITKFESELLIKPLAIAEVVEEAIPQETDTEALKQIVKFATHLTIRWDKVWTLAERRLEVIQEAERMVQSRAKKP